MTSIVRQSKFRHVFCKPAKHEQCMSGVRITEITWDSLFCAVNEKFIAIINKGSGGPFLVIPIIKVGRIDKDYPFVDAHRAPCLEVAWSPFNDNVIASCSEDTTCKVWLIPQNGLMRTLSEPVVELSGHQKRVNTITWHPSANNILLTAGGENKLLMWNVGTGEALLEISGHPDMICLTLGKPCLAKLAKIELRFAILLPALSSSEVYLTFGLDGSRFVTTCKDRKIRVIDSHTGNVLHQGMGHEGVKPQRAIFLQDGRIFTTGFTKRSERLYALRYQENIDEPIVQEELDTSNGVLFPLYDEDTGLLYLAGKGDCAIRYYEVNNESPYVHYINTYTTSEPQRGIAFMPKLGLNSNENEVARIYKITTKGIVEELQFFVPRKSDLFQMDLYPDTRSQVPALSAEHWIDGANAPPNLTPVNLAAAEAKPKVNVAKKANILAQLQLNQEQVMTQRNETTSQQSTSSRSQAPKQENGSRISYHDETQGEELKSKRSQPLIDDDMGIVRVEKLSAMERDREHYNEKPSAMVPKQQVALRSRADRDGGASLTAGQRRAAAELDRIKREKAREPDRDDLAPPVSSRNTMSPRHSISSSVANESMSFDELLNDVQKMKSILRQHERRIRLLEDELADRNMAQAYGF